MRKVCCWVKCGIVIAIPVVLIAFLAAGWLFYRSMPDYTGHVRMPGLSAVVRIYHDDKGVPHIFAANMNDAARALGYLHASERLFQMEMQRRAGRGELSAVIGPDMLGVDRFVRTLGLYQLAEDSYRSMSPEAQKFFSAYADGVNVWLKTHRQALPPEFIVMGIKPEIWKPADSIVWGKLMALQLSHNYKLEVLRAKLAAKLTPKEMEDLFPPPPKDAPITLNPKMTATGAVAPAIEGGDLAGAAIVSAQNDAVANALDKLGRITGLDQAASNEWVIAGTKTKTGKPILANDPHLGLEAPVLWYLVHIVTPGLALRGATVPGLPIVLLGQNDQIAWGFTTTGSDVEDLFVETVDPKNPDRYLTPEGPEPFKTRTEIIHVKSAPDETITVRSTRHGPLLSDIDPELAALAGKGKVMALAFTALDTHDTTSEALMRLDRAKDWSQFQDALKLYQAPPQNIVYADRAGNIGFIVPGLAPIRKKGEGLLPSDGASGDYDWAGYVPFDAMPKLYNPPAGYIFNANNAVVGDDFKYFLGKDWEEPYRARRLQELFDQTSSYDLDTSAAMQADHISLAARQLLPFILRQQPKDKRLTDAITMLRGWDGMMDQSRPEPLVFEAWLFEMHKWLAAKTGDAMEEEGPFDAMALAEILSHDPAWCRAAPHSAPDCNSVIQDALRAALAFLSDRHGSDMRGWRWGSEHQARLDHKFYSHIPLLRLIADLHAASSGDFYTLDRGGGSADDAAHPFARTHGGGYRAIYDLDDPKRSRFMIASGESGHIFSPHYRDLFALWNKVDYIPLSGTPADLRKRGAEEMDLVPSGK